MSKERIEQDQRPQFEIKLDINAINLPGPKSSIIERLALGWERQAISDDLELTWKQIDNHLTDIRENLEVRHGEKLSGKIDILRTLIEEGSLNISLVSDKSRYPNLLIPIEELVIQACYEQGSRLKAAKSLGIGLHMVKLQLSNVRKKLKYLGEESDQLLTDILCLEALGAISTPLVAKKEFTKKNVMKMQLLIDDQGEIVINPDPRTDRSAKSEIAYGPDGEPRYKLDLYFLPEFLTEEEKDFLGKILAGQVPSHIAREHGKRENVILAKLKDIVPEKNYNPESLIILIRDFISLGIMKVYSEPTVQIPEIIKITDFQKSILIQIANGRSQKEIAWDAQTDPTYISKSISNLKEELDNRGIGFNGTAFGLAIYLDAIGIINIGLVNRRFD